MEDRTREKVFKAFRTSNDYDLYLKMLNIIQDEIKQAVTMQLSERRKFQTSMMNKTNNAGWDDESTHGKTLDMIRKEGRKIFSIADKYGIDRDEV